MPKGKERPMDTLKDIGSAVLEQLKQKFTPTIYELWFKSLQLVSLDGDTAVFSTDSNFKQDLIAKRHAGSIRDALREVVGFDVKVVIESREDSEGFHIPEIKDKPDGRDERAGAVPVVLDHAEDRKRDPQIARRLPRGGSLLGFPRQKGRDGRFDLQSPVHLRSERRR